MAREEELKSVRRVEWVDGLKAWAIFLVVLGHVVEEGTIINQIIYLYHMPLFFMISGIAFYLSANRVKTDKGIPFEYLSNRLINLSIPMLFFTVINICANPNGDIFFYYNGVWFLLHLGLILSVYCMIEKLNCKKIGVGLVLGGWIVMGLLQVFLIQNHNLTGAKFACEISKWCGYYLTFNCGIYIYSYMVLLRTKKTELILVSLFILTVFITFKSEMQENVALFRILAGVTGGGYTVLAFSKRKRIYYIEKLFAAASLEIYLIHVNVLERIVLPHTTYGNQMGLLRIVYAMLLVTFYLAIPVLIYWLEKYLVPLKFIFHPISVFKRE